MLLLIDTIKLLYHADMVRDPQIHGWVLNLYRAGEKYPQLVKDYFPWKAAPWKELSLQIQQHEKDESRHERLLGKTLQTLKQPLVEFRGEHIFNHVIRKHTPISFRMNKNDSKENLRLKLAHFLAHAHCLEKRVLRSLEYHYEACEKAGNKRVAKVMRSILNDEKKHVEYTKQAAHELLPARQISSVFKLHHKAEARANLEFSKFQVKNFLNHYAKTTPLSRRALYQFCSWVMGMAARYV